MSGHKELVMKIPEGVTPKKLYKLSAETIANELAITALPVLELFLADDYFYDKTFFSSRDAIMEYLNELRIWFWRDTAVWLGAGYSLARQRMDRALSDVLHHHCKVMAGPRDQQLFAVFLFQLLFQYQAGKVTTAHSFGVLHFCRHLNLFLERLHPFSVKTLDLKNFDFVRLEPVAHLIQSTPYLTSVSLYSNCDSLVLRKLYYLYPGLEEILLSFKEFFLPTLEEELFKVFFCGAKLEDVIGKVRGKQVCLSFPRLRKFTVIETSESDMQNMQNFIFCLHLLYPNLQVNWPYNVCTQQFMHGALVSLKTGIFCPRYVAKNSICLETVAFRRGNTSATTNVEDQRMHFVKLKAKTVFVIPDFFSIMDTPDFVADILLKFQCTSLQMNYDALAASILKTVLGSSTEILTELYLDGPLMNRQDAGELFAVLNSCITLKVLALKVNLIQAPRWESLKDLPSLEVLSVRFLNYPKWFGIETSAPYIRAHMNLLGISVDIPAYMRDIETINVLPLWGRTLDDSSSSENESLEQSTNRESGGILSESRRNAIFGVGPVTFDIPSPSLVEYGYGALSAVGTLNKPNFELVPKSPYYSYYGNASYRFRAQDSNRVISSPSSSDNAEDGHSRLLLPNLYSSVVTNLYSSVDFVLIHHLAKNHLLASLENKLKQWRLDMDFKAPLNLLGSLLSVTSNLKVLEIPDIRFHDVYNLFLDERVRRNISKVHTLHLFAQYTKPLVEAIQRFPSLETLRVDPSYGIDNFLRFKRFFQSTNLAVEFSTSEVFPVTREELKKI